MIVQRIRSAPVDETIKDLVLDILRFENTYANQEQKLVKYKDEYLKLIQKYTTEQPLGRAGQ